MDINTIALIIITAFINLAVSSFIFYRYQKKIEDSFAKSMLEYQTKFVRNHEKMVETLETIYKRFSEFRLEINRQLMDKINLQLPVGEFNIQRDEARSSFNKADELFDYFVENSIHLPQNVSAEIGNILTKIKLLGSVVEIGLFLIHHSKNSLIEFQNPSLPRPGILIGNVKDTLQNMLDVWEIKINGIDKDDFDFDTLLGGVIELLKGYSDIIEKHYREISSTN